MINGLMKVVMADYNANNNIKTSGHGKKKPVFAAALIVVVLVAALVIFLASKNSVFLSLAKYNAKNGNFEVASALIGRSGHENSAAVEEYINLRSDINASYPSLLTDYDPAKIKGWAETAERLCGESEALGEVISAEVTKLSVVLSQMVSAEEEYIALRADILDMMDVFNEINRLHTKDAEGKNTAFTIAEERAKISNWERLNISVMNFISRVPGNENIYLLNYMAKEVQGEISELNDALNGVASSGYSETDTVRFSGDAVKRFPDITNSSGESVNLLDKITYEKFMYDEFCDKLVQNLVSYYMP